MSLGVGLKHRPHSERRLLPNASSRAPARRATRTLVWRRTQPRRGCEDRRRWNPHTAPQNL
eukprot:6545981-Pyramimonas_sp.AAC.1